MTIRVVLVDDQDLVRTGFRMILEEMPGLEVVGEASDGGAAVAVVEQVTPDVILMDVRMPQVDGVEATRRIVARNPNARILILTTFDLDEYAFAGLRAGASGFLLKDVPVAELVTAIEAVASGDAVVSPRITRQLLDAYASQLPPDGDRASAPVPKLPEIATAAAKLTARELEVLLEVAAGLSNLEIAAKLFVSETTVKTHVTNILAKLDLRNRVHAVIFAYQNGLIRSGD